MHACTIVARDDVVRARVLVDSHRRHHPEDTFTVLLLDDPARGPVAVGGAEVVLVDRIGIAAGPLDELTTVCAVSELATALKPSLLLWMLDRGLGHAVFLDPDVWLARPMAELPGLARDHSVVLVPYLTEPDSCVPARPEERRPTGTFDPGFVAVGDTADARAMLRWWSTQMLLQTPEQRVLDLVPGLFDHVVVRDPSWGVAWWNLGTRPLARTGDVVTAAGHPLTFVRFAGHSPEQPHLLSGDQGPRPRVLLGTDPVLRALCARYDESLREAAVGFTSAEPAHPRNVRDGVVLTPLVRRLVRAEVLERHTRTAADAPPDAPAPAIGGRPGTDLATWLASPDPATSVGGLGRLLSAVHAARPDVRATFPGAAHGDLAPLLEWAAAFGVTELDLPAATIEAERRRLAAGHVATYVSHPALPPGKRRRVHGVEVLGYFTAELGLGEAARQVVGALEHAGVSVTTSTYTRTLSRRGVEWIDRPGRPDERVDTLLLCITADQTPAALAEVRSGYTHGRYRIGLWFWELEDLPEPMQAALDLVDEVWVASEFNAVTLRALTTKPVVVVPQSVHAPAASDLRIAEVADPAPYTFLFVFDFFSVAERKNPWGLVDAFRRAFPEPGRARLVIKSVNGERRPLDLERLRHVAAGRDDIVLIERYLTRAELDGLVRSADCYVSLHRSEGFGQTLAEAMAIGKPVIATGYSGNLAFMRSGDLLVRHTMAPVPPGCEPYPTTAQWADPDLAHAAALMRQVYDDPEAARALGREGAQRLAAEFSTANLAATLRARLEEIWRERDRGRRELRESRRRADTGSDPAPVLQA